MYHKKIIDRIKNSDSWPRPERGDFLDKLDEVANNSFNKNTVEGYLAALLIYHQLTEELIKILIDCSEFFIQLSIFPQEYIKRDLTGKMFGQLINELKHSVTDNCTKKLITQSQKLNKLRIEMVHKLTISSSLIVVKMQCKQVKEIFDSIFELYEDIYDNYRVTFSKFKKYPEELEDMIE